MFNGFIPLGGIGSWTPFSPGNLLAWYDVKVGVTAAPNITAWDDQSGNGYQFTDSGGNGPLFMPTGWNGSQPAVVFNATNQFLIHTGGLATYPSTGGNANPLSIFMVIEANNVTNAHSVFLNWDDNNTIASVASYSVDGYQHLESAYGGSGLKVSGSITATGLKAVIGFAVGIDGYFNSYVNTSKDMIHVGPRDLSFPGTLARVLLGQGWNGFTYSGKIVEIVMYSKKLTDEDYSKFYDYAKLKWNGL